jgi:putative transposase
MARLSRLALPGLPHCVLQQPVHGSLLVQDDADRAALLKAVHDAAGRHQVAVWAYAIEPAALHLVLCPSTAEALGRMMQTLGRHYVPGFNRRHGRTGALWAGRFRAAVVEPGHWLLQALLRVDRLGGWADSEGARWCSAAHRLGQRRDPGLADPPEWWALGNTPFERESAWRMRLQQGLDQEAEAALARAVHGAWAVGSPSFKAKVAALAGRPTTPRPAGRPLKSKRAEPVPD